MLIAIILITTGFLLLTWSADRLVMGASAIAEQLGVSPLLVGLTIVALGTSAPEIFVSTVAAFEHKPEIALGNVLGSNIANIGLVLGFTAMLKPVTVNPFIFKREMPMLLLITALASLLLLNQQLGRIDGIILLVGLFAFIGWLVWLKQHHIAEITDAEEYHEHRLKPGIATFWVIVGLVLLPVSAKMLISGATTVALAFGVSDLVIGLTLLAIGTSLPELATAIMCVRKGEQDLAVGNIVGSNCFNILAVLPFPGLIYPSVISEQAIHRDLLCMVGFTLLLTVFAFTGIKKRNIKHGVSRTEGVILLALFFSYLWFLYKTMA